MANQTPDPEEDRESSNTLSSGTKADIRNCATELGRIVSEEVQKVLKTYIERRLEEAVSRGEDVHEVLEGVRVELRRAKDGIVAWSRAFGQTRGMQITEEEEKQAVQGEESAEVEVLVKDGEANATELPAKVAGPVSQLAIRSKK